MKFVIRSSVFFVVLSASALAHADAFEDVLRKAARDNGFVPAEESHVTVDQELAQVGGELFRSKSVSLNGDISCRDCHLDEFGSADGIPNAIGVGGAGKGAARVEAGGAVIPRNTLPLWGRGGIGFDVFFWDGKVDFSNGDHLSQFGDLSPSTDPLVTTVHLPPVEIREMLVEDNFVRTKKQESVESAEGIYAAVMQRLLAEEPQNLESIASHFSLEIGDLSYIHVATAIATFIRSEFRLKETRFHMFVFGDGNLTKQEILGGLIFYGKGKCSTCHSGPYLTDFAFHAIAFPQLGFGKNGFGIDYGRYNVTHNPDDLYKFRTPPLYNVDKTAPYGHSGSVADLRQTIIYHFDPLSAIDVSEMSELDRHEYYKKLAAAAENVLQIGILDLEEVDALVAFLKALNY